MDDLSPDDQLSPLDKLRKYFQSEDVGERWVGLEGLPLISPGSLLSVPPPLPHTLTHRDIALRIIPDAVQSITNFADFDLLLDIVFALAADYGMSLSTLSVHST